MENNLQFLAPELLLTADGSHTLFHPVLDETYHSKHGAIQESMHVFISNGLVCYTQKNPHKKQINILEVGLGTGLNALLTATEISDKNYSINYCALEAFPPKPEILEQLNYAEILHHPKAQSILQQIHICEWGKMLSFTENFNFTKHQIKLQQFQADFTFDIIYFDAFAPQVQPELWTVDIFKKLYQLMAKNALLVTYCAKGDVRRNMQSTGFLTERLPGPPGKREMLRATKS